MATALDFTYRYAQPSQLVGRDLQLATCVKNESYPYFFEGRALYPERLAQQLLVLTKVVRTHFFLPTPPILDPVLTSSEKVLRAEGFSGCCGVYARVDLPAHVFEGECKGRGTTNVDFNDPMRRALLGIRRGSEVNFAVGQDEVALESDGHKTVEKKVKLPVRWLKSFSEVQAYQAQLEMRFDIPAAKALNFLRTFPRSGGPKGTSYVVSAGSGLRLSQRPKKGGVPFAGTHRAAVLEPLLKRAKGLRIWSHEETGVSGWEVYGEAGRVFLLLSPEVYRGFSGEGQLLSSLAGGQGADILTKVKAQLRWQSAIDADALAAQLKVDRTDVSAALAILGSRGLAGYDATSERYFHRELPFDLSQVESLQPRLLAARKLLESGGIQALKEREFQVKGTDVFHHVRLLPQGDRCSCPWFSKHQGQRGPCKHILAVQLFDESTS